MSPASPGSIPLPSPRYAPYLSAATVAGTYCVKGRLPAAPPSPAVPITPISAASTSFSDRESYPRMHGFGASGIAHNAFSPGSHRFPHVDHRLPPMTHIHQQQYQAESAAHALNTMHTLNAERYHTLMLQQQQQQGRPNVGLGIDTTGDSSLAGMPFAGQDTSHLLTNGAGSIAQVADDKRSPSDTPDLSNTPSTGYAAGNAGASPSEFSHQTPQDQAGLPAVYETAKVFPPRSSASVAGLSPTHLEHEVSELERKHRALQAATSMPTSALHTHGHALPRSHYPPHLQRYSESPPLRPPITPLAGMNLSQSPVVQAAELGQSPLEGGRYPQAAHQRVPSGGNAPTLRHSELPASISARKASSSSISSGRRGSVAASATSAQSQHARTVSAERGTARQIEKQVIQESLAMARGTPLPTVKKSGDTKMHFGDDEDLEEPDDDKDEDYHE